MYKYQQIYQDLKTKITRSDFEQGEKLPSIRHLSIEYQCNKDTIIKALTCLCEDMLIYAVDKSGYYVLADFTNKSIAQNELEIPEYALFPFADFRLCVNQALSVGEMYLYDNYPQQTGLIDLIDSFYRLLPSYGLYAKKEQVVITSGIQQALYILLALAVRLKAKIIIEQPTYHRLNDLVKQVGLEYVTLNRTSEGIDFERLEKLFADGEYRYFYTISRQHNPLGVSYTENQKQKLADLARKYNVYIIEDDFRADFAPANSAPIHYYDTAERIIYLKSFSSIVFPSLRVGAVLLPISLQQEFLLYKQMIDYDFNIIIQKALSLYIDNGMLAKHRTKQIKLQKQKLKSLEPLLKEQKNKQLKFYSSTILGVLPRTLQAYQLKSGLPDEMIDFIEESYIDYCPYKYFTIDYLNMDKNLLANSLPKLIKKLKN